MANNFLAVNKLPLMLKELLKTKSLTQKDLAERMGIKPSSVNQWVKGTSRPDPSRLVQLANELGVTVDVLLGETGSNQEAGQEAGIYVTGNIGSIRANIAEFYTQVPFLSARAQAGIPQMTYDGCSMCWIDETYPVFMPVVPITKKHLIIEVQGDSMEPEIKSGALVLAELISPSDIEYESGGVYAVLYGNGRFVIKRIKTNDITTQGHLTLWSDNDLYGHITLRAHDIHCMWKITMKVAEVVR